MKSEQQPSGTGQEGCPCQRGDCAAEAPPGCTAGLLYWCETCQQELPGKRCPLCGLKARKLRR